MAPIDLEDEHLAQLLSGVARREEACLTALFDAISPRVLGLARHLLRDAATAEEVVLDVFEQIWRSAADFAPERGSATGWILRITRTRTIDRLRRIRRQRSREVELLEGDEASCSGRNADAGVERFQASGGSPDQATLEKERRVEVLRAVGALDGSEREVVALAYFAGLTHREISEELRLPLGTVKTRIRLALRKLRLPLASWAIGSRGAS